MLNDPGGTVKAMSRWREAGHTRLRWGSRDASGTRSFDDDLMLFEAQVEEVCADESSVLPAPVSVGMSFEAAA